MTEGVRILVVDDDPSMARTLVDIFTVKGHQAEAVQSGAEALERIRAGSYDCVLSDIKMPGINGVELYRAIRQMEPELPVVLMSAYAADRLVREGLEEGVLACLAKPLDIHLLLGFFAALREECTVTVVDDDPAFCRTLDGVLKARGFNVTTAQDPAEVLQALAPDRHVVLLDMKLDGATGLDVFK